MLRVEQDTQGPPGGQAPVVPTDVGGKHDLKREVESVCSAALPARPADDKNGDQVFSDP
ncbi:hypothetical protein GCM10010497_53880 [Streptomyces cinereoruber]|uniref:Uncharacterized protein n=1 Tax=Streptomyces cinereoruber TaxID=67260 RepID=A0AAV4KT98_9ACTN|nr:hypothetical protein GCM10010497_53880 [Streptomyces cinereoruber]